MKPEQNWLFAFSPGKTPSREIFKASRRYNLVLLLTTWAASIVDATKFGKDASSWMMNLGLGGYQLIFLISEFSLTSKNNLSSRFTHLLRFRMWQKQQL
jgi:hypothetical protein